MAFHILLSRYFAMVSLNQSLVRSSLHKWLHCSCLYLISYKGKSINLFIIRRIFIVGFLGVQRYRLYLQKHQPTLFWSLPWRTKGLPPASSSSATTLRVCAISCLPSSPNTGVFNLSNSTLLLFRPISTLPFLRFLLCHTTPSRNI